MPALEAIAASGELPAARAVPEIEVLMQLFLLSNGILKRGTHATGRVIEYRAAGGTGARYHLELYLVCGDLPGLDAGVYHYGAHDNGLRRLRSGDYRSLLAEATGAAPSIIEAPAVVVATSTFWRNAWRYQARAYRHVYWDLGTTLANLLAVAAAAELPAQVVLGFAEVEVNRLLAVDGERESAVALVALGRDSAAGASAPPVAPLDLPTRPISEHEIVFPALSAMHAASSLESGAAAAAGAGRFGQLPPPKAPAAFRSSHWRQASYRTRRSMPSSGDGARRAIMPPSSRSRMPRFQPCSTARAGASRWTVLTRPHGPLHEQYLIVNNVERLDQGTYVSVHNSGDVEMLAPGNMRAEAARLACGQSYAADAHVNVYYLADLEPILEHYGNRGYRLAQLEAALHAGKLHLAAHALGLGAVGSTSDDDQVIRLFSPHAAGKSYYVRHGLRPAPPTHGATGLRIGRGPRYRTGTNSPQGHKGHKKFKIFVFFVVNSGRTSLIWIAISCCRSASRKSHAIYAALIGLSAGSLTLTTLW